MIRTKKAAAALHPVFGPYPLEKHHGILLQAVFSNNALNY